jgi:hypothetical protein
VDIAGNITSAFTVDHVHANWLLIKNVLHRTHDMVQDIYLAYEMAIKMLYTK